MIKKGSLYLLFTLPFFIQFILGGCATTTIEQPDPDIEVQPLRDRISLLETQVVNLTQALEKEKQEKQDLLKILKEKEQTRQKEKQSLSKIRGKTYHYFVIRMQTALKNAGFDPGLIDGRIGQRTYAALEKFQKENNLPTQGRLNKQTWSLLRNYL